LGPTLAGLDLAKAKTDLVAELTAYLAKLGLGDAHLARVISLLQATHGERANLPAEAEDMPPRSRRRRDALESPPPAGPTLAAASKTVNLLVAEEQQILKEAYRAFFTTHPSINLVGCSNDTSAEALVAAAASAGPSVILVGVKSLHSTTVEKLEILQENFPHVGVVLLFAIHDTGGIKALREFSRGSSAGRAYLSKHTVDTVDQLTQAVLSVAEGRIIVDPTVMEVLIKTTDAPGSLLRDLSPRALEVLGWMAKGYRNESIADVLSRDVKTIERHINNIYSTLLGPEDESKHPRVRAALMYLRATGLLSTEQALDE
jgi:two-component system nitrate/nitrite response regulator NarL